MAAPKRYATGIELEELIELSEGGKKAVGRFQSNVDQERLANEVKASKKHTTLRTGTTRLPDLISGATKINPQVYCQKVFQGLCDVLASHNLHTPRMLLRHFEWLMLLDGDAEKLTIFNALYMQALLVPDADLQTILKMELSTTKSPPTTPGSHFYLRCWTMTIKQFDALLSTLNKNEVLFEECDRWHVALQIHRSAASKDREPIFTVRYVGTCEGPKRPIDRHYEDMTYRNSGLLAEFFKALHEACPEVVSSAKVYLLPDASLPPRLRLADDGLPQKSALTDDDLAEKLGVAKDGLPQKPVDGLLQQSDLTKDNLSQRSGLTKDDIERILIELFNHDTLLNRQRGGRFASFDPWSEDAQTFRDCKTDFWANYNAKATMPSPSTTARVASHFHAVQQYANQNPLETGTATFRFTDKQREMITAQATPFQRNGMNIIVFIGKDQAIAEFRNDQDFLNGGSHAGKSMRAQIYRLVMNETQAHGREIVVDSFNPKHSAWNFVNMWPWMWLKNVQKAMKLLEQYMQIVQPLFAVSFGHNVTSIVRGNFQHGHGVQLRSGLIPVVGIPTIQYAEVGEDGEPTESSAFINIPHLHPGVTKYGTREVQLHRLMDLTMQYTFMIGDVALRMLDGDGDYKSAIAEGLTRKQLCETILEEVNRKCIESDYHHALANSLEFARKDLQKEIKASHKWGGKALPEPLPVIVGPQLLYDAASREKTADLGKAIGKPNSAQREHQVDQLWDKNLPDLHMIVPREADGKTESEQRTAWRNDMLMVPENQYYYLHLLGQLPPDLTTSQLLLRFRPTWATDDDWMDNEEARRKAAEAASLWVADGERDNADAAKPSFSYKDFVEPHRCQGRMVQPDLNGTIIMRYIDAQGERRTASLQSYSIIRKEGKNRYMYFLEQGIDIVGSVGEQIRPKQLAGTNAGVTFPVRMFATKPDVLELWKAGCKGHGIGTAALAAVPAEAKQWGEAGVPMLKARVQKETPAQNRPPQPEDGNYLLEQFIESVDHLADGGSFRTISKDKLIDSTEDMQNFVSFIKQPEYFKHPWTNEWLKYLDKSKPTVEVLAKNLPMLRSSTTVKQKKTTHLAVMSDQAGSSKSVSKHGVQIPETYFVIGGPDSAVDNPFAEGSGQSCVAQKRQKQRKKNVEEARESGGWKNLAPGSSKRKRDDEDDEGARGSESDDGEDDVDGDDEDDEDDEPPAKKLKRSSVRDDKSANDDDEDDNDDDDEPPKRKIKRKMTTLHPWEDKPMQG